MRTDSPAAHPRWSCYRKKAYSQDVAVKVAKRINEQEPGADIVDYSCRCGSWHVGRRLAGQ